MRSSTYTELPEDTGALPYGYFKIPDDNFLHENQDSIREVSRLILEHKFNFLGSGWTKLSMGMKADGLEDYKYSFEERIFDRRKWLQSHLSPENYKKALQINELTDDEFKPVDWQMDIKSGYRWDENVWYKDIQYGNLPGADIKMPWELGRMQYLPILAYAARLSLKGAGGFLTPKEYYREFRNQILCFIASNPPRFGVQWMTAMEVSQRAASWLAAYDMFRYLGFFEDKKFSSAFTASLYDHLNFITDNLEWSSGMRGNHYFINIAGLLIISSYLPESEKTTQTLAFSIQEFINELNWQFLRDGGNFEASLHYHLFTYETALWCFYFILSLPENKILSLMNYNHKKWQSFRPLYSPVKQKYEIDLMQKSIVFPKQTIDKLGEISEFTNSIFTGKDEVPQIGDNDGGCFLKLHNPYYLTDKKQVSKYLNIEKKVKSSECKLFAAENTSKKDFIQNLENVFSGNLPRESEFTSAMQIDDPEQFRIIQKKSGAGNTGESSSHAGVVLKQFPEFGIYIYNTHFYKAYIRCGYIGQKGKGGHAHNDQLSICLYCRGNNIFTDPGTYVYTPLHEKRNLFRSVKMHNTLFPDDKEQNLWESGDKDDLFWMVKDRSKARAVHTGNNYFTGEHKGYGELHTRKIEFHLSALSGEDVLEMPGKKTMSFHLHPDVVCEYGSGGKKLILRNDTSIVELEFEDISPEIEEYLYSESYGYIQKSKVIKAVTDKNVIKWNIEIISS